MSDARIRSLARQTSDPFAKQLLASARTDSPEPGARDRALLGLGLAPVGLLAVAPPAAAAAASPTASALAVSSKALPWVVGKSLAIGLLGSVVAISVLDRALGNSAPPTAAPIATAANTAKPQDHRASPAASSSSQLVPTSAPPAPIASTSPQAPGNAPRPPETSRVLVGAAASAPSVAPARDGLVELEALARVRRALATQEPGRALSLLDDFERRFPASRVAEEAAVLRIETLRALGRASEAHALGRSFLRDRPFSVYGAKVEAMMPIGDRVANPGH